MIVAEERLAHPGRQCLGVGSNCGVDLARRHSCQAKTHRHCQMRRCDSGVLPFSCENIK